VRHALLTACVAALAAVPSLGAQPAEPKRPKLAAGADTNDADAYYRLGVAAIEREPAKAADAFYWASRINPMWADAYYARRVALLVQKRHLLDRYFRGDKRVIRSPELLRADSLYLHALALQPFLYEKLDRSLFNALVHDVVLEATRTGEVSPSEVEYHINVYVQRSPPAVRAWHAYTGGYFPEALALYAQAIKRTRDNAWLHADRGRIFFQLGSADSALAELTQALAKMRSADEKKVGYLYESKALMEHRVGMVHRRLGDAAAAHEAFGRALVEDLAYYPAHMEMGFLALEAKDTTTALSEMELAVQLAGDDPWLRHSYGHTLGVTGKFKEAEVQLRKSAELDPFFAAPHYVLGQVLDAQSRGPEALQAYRRFLALARRQDPNRADAEERATFLAAGSGKP
jgi:tetratricopeptide (TPR) repeat protein